MKKAWLENLQVEGLSSGSFDKIQATILQNREGLAQILHDGLVMADIEFRRHGETPAAFSAITEGRSRWMDEANEAQLKLAAEGGHAVQCRDKCSYCCYQHVMLSCTEAFQIVRWLQSQGREVNTRANADLVRTLPHLERYQRGIACPLLKNQRCTVYPVRPMPCRSYFSSTRHLCKLGWERRWHDDTEGTSILSNPQLANHSMLLGTDAAFAMRGYQMVTLELADAIDQASQPGAWEAWFTEKKRVFIVPDDDQPYEEVLQLSLRELLRDG